MAEKEPAKSKHKRAQTVRERTQSHAQPKPRRLKRTAGNLARPVRATGRGVKKVVSPLGFVLKPFRLRPVRFVGRVLAAVLLINYFRQSWRELRQVTWPGRRETAKLTSAVFVFAVIFGLVITLTDYGLDKLFKKILLN